MSIRYDDLAVELKVPIGDLTTLGEKIGLPFAAKTVLSNEEADTLRKAFKAQSNTPATPQLNPAPVRDIQEAPASVPTAREEDPTESSLELVYQQLMNAKAAQDTQAQEMLENKIREIRDRGFRRGMMLRVAAETSEVEGFIAAGNAIGFSSQASSADLFKRETELIAGQIGEDFLPNFYPNAAKSSTEIPQPPASIAQQNLDILDRLKKS